MLRNLTFCSTYLLLILILLLPYHALGQLISGEAFLKGKYIEVGVSACGSYGTSQAPPSSYHPTEPGLGFVSDWSKDGWLDGFPAQCGDYFLPGDPEEGWGLQINGINYNNNQICDSVDGLFSIRGKITTYYSDSNEVYAIWEGEIDSLVVTQKTTIVDTSLFIITELRFENRATTTKQNVFYLRTLDPDNEFSISGSDQTNNSVVYQPTVNDSRALGSAIGTTHPCYLGLGTKDCRARISVTNQSIVDRSGAAVWTNLPPRQNTGSVLCNFCPLSLGYSIGDIQPGEARTLAFAYVLDEGDLDSALDRTSTKTYADGKLIQEDEFYLTCENAPVVAELINEGDYDWTWSPNIEIDTNKGRQIIITPSVNRVYTITGVSCDTLQFTLDIRVRPDTVAPTIICPADTLVGTSDTVCLGIAGYSDPIIQDDCPGLVVRTQSGIQRGDFINIGDSVISLIVEDVSGKTDTCSFIMSAQDNSPPVVTYLTDTTLITPEDTCLIQVNYTPPIAEDNCSATTIELTQGKGYGGIFTSGTVIDRYTASDIYGNTVDFSTSVTVLDTIPPSIQCPNDTVIGVGKTLIYQITASDNCGAYTLLQTFGVPSGGFYPFEVTNKYTAIDRLSNIRLCEFNVKINDAPIFPDQTIPINENAGPIEFGLLNASDINGHNLTYFIIDESEPGVFGINNANRKLKVLTPAKLDHETLPQVTLTVVVRDDGPANLTDTAIITVPIRDINEPPTAIDIIDSLILENQPIGTVVGTFRVEDVDVLSDYRPFVLEAGAGDEDNARFQIINDSVLVTAEILDFEAQPTHNIRIRVRDQWSKALYRKPFVISVIDINDIPLFGEQFYVTNADIPIAFQQTTFEDQYSDQDGDPMTSIRINSLPLYGQLLLNNQPITPQQIIPTPQINALAYRPDITYQGNDRFTIQASDGEDQSTKASINIRINPPLTANAGQDRTICKGDSTQLGGDPTSTGGTPPIRYQWTPDITISSSSSANPFAFPQRDISYILTTTDSIGGLATDTVRIAVGPVPTVQAGRDQRIFDGETVQFNAIADMDNLTYQWTPPTALSNPTILDPIMTATLSAPDLEGKEIITYQIQVTNPQGCKDTDQLTVTILPNLQVPTGFSPNGDGLNDRWTVRGIEAFPNHRITILDRYGQTIYETTSYDNDTGWDGTRNGKALPAVSYFYIIELLDFRKKFSGSITIVR